MGAPTVNIGVLLKSRRNMKKYKTGHFETFLGESYPEILPQWGKMGKHRINNGAFGQGPEVVETHSHTEVVTKGPKELKVMIQMLKIQNSHRWTRFGSGWVTLTKNDFRIVE
jgi:hypothetical protein